MADLNINIKPNSSKTQTWFLPYAKPCATTSILNDEQHFSQTMSPLFNNVKHTYNPHYNESYLASYNDNMLHAQPKHTLKHFKSNYTNSETNCNENKKQMSIIANSSIKKANITWKNNNYYNDIEYNPYSISEYKILPDGAKHFNNPHKINGNLISIVPWEMMEEKEDEYFNEQNFQKIFEHPFYQNMKPFLEQPFKSL